MSKKTSQQNTFGWARAEVLGALVNSVFLVALCFTILVEAIQRLTHGHEIDHIDSMIYVGIAGLVINVIGLLLFYQQGLGRRRDRDVDDVVDPESGQQMHGKSWSTPAATNRSNMLNDSFKSDGQTDTWRHDNTIYDASVASRGNSGVTDNDMRIYHLFIVVVVVGLILY